MPWTVENPPNVAKNWTDAEKRRCVRAGNAVLADGGTDEQAIRACIAAAGKSSASLTADTKATLTLRLPEEALSWEPIGAEVPVALADGPAIPSRRYKKRVIRVGSYVKMSDGIAFEVTPDTLGHWVMEFQRMRENGVRVPMPAVHRDEKWEERARGGDPRDNMGWVEDMWVEGGDLWMACQLIGTDALIAAKRGDVSLNSPPKLVDGKGREYVRPITHVCLCTDPVVPGLGEFVPIAASLRLQQENVQMLDFLKRIGAMLGLDPETLVDEAAAEEAVLEALGMMIERVNEMSSGEGESKEGGEGEGVPPTSQEGGPGKVKKETVTREYAGQFSGDNPPSPLLVKTVAENRGMKIDKLAESQKITAEQAGKLKERFATDEAISLALSHGSDGSEFDSVLELLELGRPPVKTEEQSGGQTVALADTRKGGEKKESPIVADAKRRREAANK